MLACRLGRPLTSLRYLVEGIDGLISQVHVYWGDFVQRAFHSSFTLIFYAALNAGALHRSGLFHRYLGSFHVGLLFIGSSAAFLASRSAASLPGMFSCPGT